MTGNDPSCVRCPIPTLCTWQAREGRPSLDGRRFLRAPSTSAGDDPRAVHQSALRADWRSSRHLDAGIRPATESESGIVLRGEVTRSGSRRGQAPRITSRGAKPMMEGGSVRGSMSLTERSRSPSPVVTFGPRDSRTDAMSRRGCSPRRRFHSQACNRPEPVIGCCLRGPVAAAHGG